jgi:1-acyl-sn-glycerol-3-phosphate acyltransferase
LLEQTAKQVTILGTEHLENLPACLYISNHRDILLDTAILNRALIERDKSIPHIIIGDNLLKATFLQPFYRLCRSVVVQRELKGKELFEHSLRLSEFVRSALTRNEPVWIAQRPGRTKDGIDRTEPALLRMLLLSYERKNDCCNQLLYVTPVAVSYEIEPCDVFKAAASILRGLVQPKGRITLAFRPPIVLDNSDARSSNRADKLATLASQVDREIADGYTLWPTNYIAYDLLRGRESYVEHYTNDERLRFVDYVERRALEIEAPIEHARRALLALYARPVSAEQTALALSSPQHDRGSRTVA